MRRRVRGVFPSCTSCSARSCPVAAAWTVRPNSFKFDTFPARYCSQSPGIKCTVSIGEPRRRHEAERANAGTGPRRLPRGRRLASIGLTVLARRPPRVAGKERAARQEDAAAGNAGEPRRSGRRAHRRRARSQHGHHSESPCDRGRPRPLQDPGDGRPGLRVGVLFRGYLQANHGPIVQPYLNVFSVCHPCDSVVVRPYVSLFNSAASGDATDARHVRRDGRSDHDLEEPPRGHSLRLLHDAAVMRGAVHELEARATVDLLSAWRSQRRPSEVRRRPRTPASTASFPTPAAPKILTSRPAWSPSPRAVRPRGRRQCAAGVGPQRRRLLSQQLGQQRVPGLLLDGRSVGERVCPRRRAAGPAS